jgi:hypothetical protein
VARQNCPDSRDRVRRKFALCGLSALLWQAALVIGAAPAAADDAPASMFSFGGFGTLGLVHSDQRLADFTSSTVEGAGAGRTRAWSPAVDSLFAVQVTANFTPKLSGVLQVVSEQNADSSFTPHVEWANLKYQFTPDCSVRVGRTALGVFLLADSRNIGFAYPWVRPPIELYDLVSVTESDGIGLSYRLAVAGGSNTVELSAGVAHYDYPIANTNTTDVADSNRQLSLVDTYQRGFATLRLSYGQSQLTIPTLDPLFDGFRQFGPQGIGIADLYEVNDRLITFYGLSAAYEPGDWFVMAEWARFDSHAVLGETTGWYVSGGHRFGRATPYATYAQTRADSNTSNPGLNVSGLPPELAAAAGALNAGLNASLAAVASQRTFSLGTRIDVAQSVDLKLQWDRISLGTNSQGWLTNAQPDFPRGSNLTVVSATVDFVF